MAGRIILGIANPSLDANGEVSAGSTLTFYQNGTTTLQSIYSAVDLATPLANPLTCDASGRFPQIWSPDGNSYSVKWTPLGEAPITYDNILPEVASTFNAITASTINLTGGQIKFPATQNASADKNTLDDYEEGTWTPVDGSGAALTFTIFEATYVKIGSIVMVDMTIQYPTNTSGANAIISGLPFTWPNRVGIGGFIVGFSGINPTGFIPVPNGVSMTAIGSGTGLNFRNVDFSGTVVRAQFMMFTV